MKNELKGLYTANQDTNIKYIYALGGGIKGRTIKKGEQITVIGVMNDINSQSISTKETLHRITADSFFKFFEKSL